MLLNCGVGEDSWESLGQQWDESVHPKGNQLWIFIGRTDAEDETPILWPPDVKSWLIWKDPDSGKDWGQEEKGTTEDEMAGWHYRLNGHWFGWTLGVGDGQGGLAYCGSWGRKELDTTEQLNWTKLNGVSQRAESCNFGEVQIITWKDIDLLILAVLGFVATSGLSLAASWGYSGCHARDSHCDGFCCCRA